MTSIALHLAKMRQNMVLGAKAVDQICSKISAQMLVKQKSIFCNTNFMLVPLQIARISWRNQYLCRHWRREKKVWLKLTPQCWSACPRFQDQKRLGWPSISDRPERPVVNIVEQFFFVKQMVGLLSIHPMWIERGLLSASLRHFQKSLICLQCCTGQA